MAKFDLQSYVTVQGRISRFWEENPEGAIRTELASNPSQFEQVVFRAEIYKHRDNAHPDATGYAAEVAIDDPRGGPNYTSWHENAECVPLTVPILTLSGWRFFHQLREGETVFGYCPVRERLVHTKLLAVRSFEPKPVVRIGNSRFSAICTPNHKWVIDGSLTEWSARKTKCTTTVTLASPIDIGEGLPRLAAQLGWLMTDAHIGYVNGLPSSANVVQAKDENFLAICDLFGEGVDADTPATREWENGRVSTLRRARRWAVPAQEVRHILGYFRIATREELPGAVLGMTRDEAAAFLDAAMAADGSRHTFAKTSLPVVKAVQLAAFLTGRCSSVISERAGNEMTTKPCYTVGLHKNGHKYLSEFKTQDLPPQPVWCPTTETGTWVADFNGFIGITGNTSAIGRAFANLGYATSQKDRPSREEMQKVERGRPASIRGNTGPAAAAEEDEPQITSWTDAWKVLRAKEIGTAEDFAVLTGRAIDGLTPQQAVDLALSCLADVEAATGD